MALGNMAARGGPSILELVCVAWCLEGQQGGRKWGRLDCAAPALQQSA